MKKITSEQRRALSEMKEARNKNNEVWLSFFEFARENAPMQTSLVVEKSQNIEAMRIKRKKYNEDLKYLIEGLLMVEPRKTKSFLKRICRGDEKITNAAKKLCSS